MWSGNFQPWQTRSRGILSDSTTENWLGIVPISENVGQINRVFVYSVSKVVEIVITEGSGLDRLNLNNLTTVTLSDEFLPIAMSEISSAMIVDGILYIGRATTSYYNPGEVR
jgi:hypothetical protein